MLGPCISNYDVDDDCFFVVVVDLFFSSLLIEYHHFFKTFFFSKQFKFKFNALFMGFISRITRISIAKSNDLAKYSVIEMTL